MGILCLFLLFFLHKGFAVTLNPKIFNVIRFPNDLCTANPYNGTCYTSDECEQRGGSPNGECAFGYGVCCVFNLGCGGTTTDNSTYLVQQKSSFNANERECNYYICKMSSKVCRIKLEFTAFVISDPILGKTIDDVATTGNGASIGDCVGDSFTLRSPGNQASPVICGYNTGQHMFIDAHDNCVTASFVFNTADKSTRRNYDIKVLQYICGDDMGGPPDCLQYFTEASGVVKSFNFPPTLTSSTTHLSGQNYHVCFRRASGKCSLCMTPSISITDAAIDSPSMQSSFGLSISSDAAIAKSITEISCSTDYIVFPGGSLTAIASNVGTVSNGIERFCGRIWTTNTGNSGTVATRSVCSSRRPFMMFFRTNHDEAENYDTDLTMHTAITDEQEQAPGGIIGFSFDFRQVDC